MNNLPSSYYLKLLQISSHWNCKYCKYANLYFNLNNNELLSIKEPKFMENWLNHNFLVVWTSTNCVLHNYNVFRNSVQQFPKSYSNKCSLLLQINCQNSKGSKFTKELQNISQNSGQRFMRSCANKYKDWREDVVYNNTYKFWY